MTNIGDTTPMAVDQSHDLGILKDNGILFLKCFSDKEPMEEGPHKFSQDEIKDLFSESFIIDSIKETVYQGTLNPFPKALFVVMIKGGRT